MSSLKKSIRCKLFFFFIISSTFSGTLTIIMVILLNSLAFGSYNNSILWLNQNVEFIPLFLVFSGVIFIFILSVLFYLMTQKSINYLKQISLELHKISEGNFDITIPINTKDELGELAQDINSMSYKLKKSFEEERNAQNANKELINNVSHDLRTPLTSIIGYLDLISKRKYANEEELVKYSSIAHNKTLSLNKLVGQLFEYSKLNSNSQKLNINTINLVEIIEQVLTGFIPEFRDLDMEYRLMVMKKPIMVNADVNLIVRLFENIIGNALKYGRQGRYVDIDLDTTNNIARVSISDYGDAIPEAEAEKIFERLYRIDKSRTGDEAGAGLGLSIAKSIAKAHNGDVNLIVLDDKKTFVVLIPMSNTINLKDS